MGEAAFGFGPAALGASTCGEERVQSHGFEALFSQTIDDLRQGCDCLTSIAAAVMEHDDSAIPGSSYDLLNELVHAWSPPIRRKQRVEHDRIVALGANRSDAFVDDAMGRAIEA